MNTNFTVMKLLSKLSKSKSSKHSKGISNTDIIPFLSPFDPFTYNHDPFAKLDDNKYQLKQLPYKSNHLKTPLYKVPSLDDISLPDLSEKGDV
ncbi:hypothetical protein E3P99_00490 [Wallemia hederae]|uniref:Uncharacterized protein n=1 Tax=Wallemia hederae TaxID=1540922 RepID=A0A4T0FWH2_9BASI|nr:hypothetical protein E3P99_00490 [Wallemia hederae]